VPIVNRQSSIVNIAAAAALLLLAGCVDTAIREVSAPSDVYTARKPAASKLELTVPGRIDNRVPIGHRPSRSWMSVKWVRPEGEEVAPGDRLIVFDTDLVQLWFEQRETDIEVEELQLALSRLRTQRKLVDLRLKKADLQAKRETLDKGIAATRIKDERQLEIARLELELAEAALTDARTRLAAIRVMQDSGTVSRLAIRRAMDAYEKAFQATRLPRVKLELLEDDTGASSRHKLELDLQALQFELGNAAHKDGVFGEIAALEELQRMRERIQTHRLRRLELAQRTDREALEHNYIEASATGMLKYRRGRDGDVEPGVKLSSSSVAFVLENKEMIAYARLPERWRNLLGTWTEQAPAQGRATVAVPGLGHAALAGRVLSIGTAPRRASTGAQKEFNCAVRLDEKDPALRVGMRVRCTFHIPLPEQAVVIPTWLVANLREPRVRLRDGTTREITGYVVGHDFVVVRGLHGGEQILAPAAGPDDGNLRLTGVVSAPEVLPVRVPGRHWRLEITDIVPDGSFVHKDQVVARLTTSWGNTDRDEMQVEAGGIEAESQFVIDKINAESNLVKAYVRWKKAKVAQEQTRLAHLIARYVSYAPDITRAEVQVANSRIELDSLEAQTRIRTAPFYRDIMSLNQVRSLELRLALAEIGHAKAALKRIGDFRKRDWLSVWSAQEKMRAAEQDAFAERVAYSLAREKYQLDIQRAYDRRQRELDHIERHQRQLDSETIRAPRDGRVFYAKWRRRSPTVGERLDASELFVMPLGAQRQFEIEVPVRYHGRFEIGQSVPLVVPALGRTRRQGVVRRLSHFMHGQAAWEQRVGRGTIGEPEKVFKMTLAFELRPDEIEKGVPGITAYVDL